MAQLLLGEAPSIDLIPFSPNRHSARHRVAP
jgi:hypothetical protein